MEEVDPDALNVIDVEVRSYFTSRTSYRALVFSAPWGSGKTTLIKRWMRDNTSTSRRKQRKQSKFEPITYISAFGAKDGADLLARIYAEVISVQSWAYRTTNSVGKNAYEIVGLSRDAAAQALLRFAVKPRYLIIDDLERIDLDGIKSIFGAINIVSEQMGVETIILCDIDKITIEDHGIHAEKIVKEVIRLEIDNSFAIRNIFNKECSDLPREFVAADMFADAILESGTKNLRYVEKAAQNYRRFIRTIRDLPLNNLNNIGQLTYGLTAYCIENQIKSLTKNDLDDINRYFAHEDQSKRVKHLAETYTKFNITQSYVAPLTASLITNVIINNCSNVAAIKEEILSTHHYRKTAQAEWQVVWHLTTSPRADIDKAIIQQREKVASRAYLNTGIILHVFSNELRLSEIGASHRDYRLIVSDAKRYVDDVKENSSLEVHYEKDGILYDLIDISSYMGLGYPSPNSDIYPHFMEIWEYMRVAIEKNKQKLMLNEITSIFQDIAGNIAWIDDFLTNRHNSKYENQLIHNLDHRSVARQIGELEAPLRYRVNLCLSTRVYKREHDRQDEIAWLKTLGTELVKIAQAKDAIDKHAITAQAEHFLGYKPEFAKED